MIAVELQATPRGAHIEQRPCRARGACSPEFDQGSPGYGPVRGAVGITLVRSVKVPKSSEPTAYTKYAVFGVNLTLTGPNTGSGEPAGAIETR